MRGSKGSSTTMYGLQREAIKRRRSRYPLPVPPRLQSKANARRLARGADYDFNLHPRQAAEGRYRAGTPRLLRLDYTL